MTDLAKHSRIYDPSPADETISKRQSAIDDCVKKLRRISQPAEIIELASAAAEAFASNKPGTTLEASTVDAIKTHAPAFLEEESQLEVAVLAILSVIAFLETTDTSANTNRKDLLAAAIWSAIGYQQPIEDEKLEALRAELLDRARDRCARRAAVTRDRRKVPTNLEEAPEGSDAEVMRTGLNGALRAIEALRLNSLLDQEEINIAWWAMGGWSTSLNKAYDTLSDPLCGVTRGIELGALLRGVPAQSHRNLALIGVNGTEPIALGDVLTDLAADQDALSDAVPGNEIVVRFPSVFPLLSAIVAGTPRAGTELKSEEWCERSLLETTIAHLAANSPTGF